MSNKTSVTISNKKKLLNSKKIATQILYMLLIFYVIVIFYIGGIIHYLIKLNNCECYKIKNEENRSNLTYLLVIEFLLLIFYIIIVIVLASMISVINNFSGGANKKMSMAYYIGLLIYLLIYGFFIFYTYKLSQNVDPKCECTQSWLRYLLYIQAFVMLVGLLSVLYLFFSMQKN
jgi:membrane protease YdiL (CAAX protease family)